VDSKTKYLEIKEKVKNIDPEVGILDKEGWLLYKLARKNNLGPVVEIGSWKGRSTIWLAQACVDKLKEGEDKTYLVYAVDPHQGTGTHSYEGQVDTYQEFLSNIEKAGVSEIVKPIRMLSKAALSEVIWESKIQGLGLVFIDGSHDFEDVSWEVTNWGQALKVGGVLALHDCIGYSGPKDTVELMLLSREWKWIGICGQVVAFKKINKTSKVWLTNIWWFLYWRNYSLLFLLAKKILPKRVKDRIK